MIPVMMTVTLKQSKQTSDLLLISKSDVDVQVRKIF